MKRPRDTNQLAKNIVDIATGEREEPKQEPVSVMTVTEFARLGGLKGGVARAKALTKSERIKIAKSGAKARWGKRPKAA
jgi:hypothetical protein